MAIEKLTLEDASQASKDKFQAVLDQLGVGEVVVLGADMETSFNLLVKLASAVPANLVLVWAKDKESVREAIQGLTGGDEVNFGPNGHGMVGINRRDIVCEKLSRFDATQPLDVFGVVLCAAQ